MSEQIGVDPPENRVGPTPRISRLSMVGPGSRKSTPFPGAAARRDLDPRQGPVPGLVGEGMLAQGGDRGGAGGGERGPGGQVGFLVRLQ